MSQDLRLQLEPLAAAFLQESVFASRQASHAFTPRSLEGASGCGLGLKPAVPDDFSPSQAELIERMLALRGGGLPFDHLRQAAATWIKIQDGIDRQRNHFLKDFRHAHGFDRAAWAPPVEADFKAGLDEINAGNRARLREHAEALAALLG